MTIKIELQNFDGEFVKATVIPAFKMLPDVVVWGIRTFQQAGVSSQNVPVFREVFAYAIVDLGVE